VWHTANWHEREAYDMLGMLFEGHPDIYEGTGQINRLVVARALLGYRGSELR